MLTEIRQVQVTALIISYYFSLDSLLSDRVSFEAHKLILGLKHY